MNRLTLQKSHFFRSTMMNLKVANSNVMSWHDGIFFLTKPLNEFCDESRNEDMEDQVAEHGENMSK